MGTMSCTNFAAVLVPPCWHHDSCEPPDKTVLLSMLRSCGRNKDVDVGQKLHGTIVKMGLDVTVAVIGTAILDMYAKCSHHYQAENIFQQLPLRNTVSWNALITGYVQCGRFEEALSCYNQMQEEGLIPNEITYTCILKVYGNTQAVEKGEEVHAQIIRDGLLDKDVKLGTALMDMYLKFGDVKKAECIFETLPMQDIVLCNTLIGGYVQQGLSEQAIKCFQQIEQRGICPNNVTFLFVFKACGKLADLKAGEEIYTDIVNRNVMGKNIVLGSALVDMFCKCGALTKAQAVFDSLPVHDVVSWTALIAGYSKSMQGEEALKCFELMQLEGFSPDKIAYVNALKACGSVGASSKGQEMHAAIMIEGPWEQDMIVGNALLEMYAKCDMLTEAQEIFDDLPILELVSWTHLISGYAQVGKDDIVFTLFNEMLLNGHQPDHVVFTVLMNMCSHLGLLDKGRMLFHTMSTCYGILPNQEQHTCMIDLCSRAGQLDKALDLMLKIPFNANSMTWNNVLSASRKCGSLSFGEIAFNNALSIDGTNPAPYVFMQNIYVNNVWQTDGVNM